jgi:hypothetical protein
VVLPKFEPEAMRQHLYKKVDSLFRARAKLVKIFGKYYYKAMAEDEFKAKFSKFFMVDHREIENEQELADFLAKEQCIRDPYDEVQYKFIFLTNYLQSQSVVVFKCHQCMADGLGILHVLLNLQDKSEEGQLALGRQHSLMERLQASLFKPIEALSVAAKIMLLGKEKNLIHQGKHPTGIKNAAFSQDVPLAKLDKKAAELGLSQGQLVLKLLAQSFNQYMNSEGPLKLRAS